VVSCQVSAARAAGNASQPYNCAAFAGRCVGRTPPAPHRPLHTHIPPAHSPLGLQYAPGCPPGELLRLLGSLERGSSHPLAAAIMGYAASQARRSCASERLLGCFPPCLTHSPPLAQSLAAPVWSPAALRAAWLVLGPAFCSAHVLPVSALCCLPRLALLGPSSQPACWAVLRPPPLPEPFQADRCGFPPGGWLPVDAQWPPLRRLMPGPLNPRLAAGRCVRRVRGGS
jgi:hypothetical protein